jgi:hypothetical protein
MWSRYKPMEAQRFIRLSEIDHRVFKGTGHDKWKRLIEAGTMMVDIDTGTVFQTKTHQGFRLVRVQTKTRIDTSQNTGAGGGGGGLGGHGEGRRYDVLFHIHLPKGEGGKQTDFRFNLHCLMVGCILKSAANFPPRVDQFEGDHTTGDGHEIISEKWTNTVIVVAATSDTDATSDSGH